MRDRRPPRREEEESQLESDAGTALTPTQPHQRAALSRTVGNQALQQALEGLAGSPAKLPYLEALERAFGRHSLADVEAHLGPAAAETSRELDAEAYTVGEQVAFAGAPDLRTAAHEAAHVIQQRAGVDLPEGRGRRGDEHERHADAVADAVVAGRSAAPLLDRCPESASPGAPALQLQERDPSADSYEAAHPDFRPRAYAQPDGAGMATQGRYDLPGGTLTFALVPRVGYVNARIEFTPNAELARTGQTISFIQTVTSTLFNGGQSELDVLPRETDPYYGASWDEGAGTWSGEPGSVQRFDAALDDPAMQGEGSRPFTPATGSAVLNDSPHLNVDEVKFFDTHIVVVETGQVLGRLIWNIQHRKAGFFPDFVDKWMGWASTSTIVRNVQCLPGSSAELRGLLDQFYRDHPEARRPGDGSVPPTLRSPAP